MSGNSGKIEWYLARDGQQHGPLSAVELDKFIELGHLKPTDLLWRAGFDDWRMAPEVFPPLPPQQVQPPVGPSAPMSAQPQPSDRAAATQSLQQDVRSDTAAFGTDSLKRHGETTQPVRKINVTRETHAQRSAGGRPAASYGGAQQSAQLDLGSNYAASPETAPQARTGERKPQTFAVHPASPSGGMEHGDYGPAPSGPGAATQRPARSTTAVAQPANVALPTAVMRPGAETVDEEFLEEEGGRGGWLMVAAALFLFVLLGAGGLFAYNNQSEIAALYAEIVGEAKPAEVAVVRAPTRAVRQPISKKLTPPVAAAPINAREPAVQPLTAAVAKSVSELPILKSKLWQYAQKEFGKWTEERLAELAEQDKSKEEANKYLIKAFVRFRRDNANHALLASSSSLEEVATAFVTSLRALTERGPNACYAFISNGETTPEVAPLYMEPSIGPKLEAQMLAILKAIVDGKSSPTIKRQPPTSADFDKLSAELGKRGWSAADLKLFSDPGALSKAEPKVVCRLVTEWFATQTKLGDQVARDQLIAASLRPVIGG